MSRALSARAAPLQVRLDRVLEDLEQAKAALRAAQEQMRPTQQLVSRLVAEAGELREQLASANREPRVSDHAIIRYFERKCGVSFEEVRESLLTPDRVSAILAGATAIKHDGLKFLVKDHTITTIVDVQP